jgi:hypothetical protein
MLKSRESFVMLVLHCAAQAVVNLFFANLCLLKSGLALVLSGIHMFFVVISDSFALITGSALIGFFALIKTASILLQFFYSDFLFMKCGVQTLTRFVTACFLSVKLVTEKCFRLVDACCISPLKAGANGAFDCYSDVICLLKKGIRILLITGLCLINIGARLALFIYYFICGIYRLSFHVAKAGRNFLERVIFICFHDLKAGRKSEILQLVVICCQLVKTGSLAVLYMFLLCFHIVKTGSHETVKYIVAFIKSVRAVETTACVISDSSFCNDSH